MRGNAKGQSHVHAARIVLDRSIDEFVDLRELDDLVELAINFATTHPEDRAVEIDVLTAGKLWIEACSNLEQAPDPPIDVDLARRRLCNPGKNLEESRLPRTISPNDADDLTWHDLEANITECPDPLAINGFTIRGGTSERDTPEIAEGVAQCQELVGPRANLIFLT